MFNGTIIGIVLPYKNYTEQDFTVRHAHPKKNNIKENEEELRLKTIQRLIKMYREDDAELFKYKAAIGINDSQIWLPPIREIYRQNFHRTFYIGSIKWKIDVELDSIYLINPNNFVISKCEFEQKYFKAGDTSKDISIELGF